jgi:hypothetical protein
MIRGAFVFFAALGLAACAQTDRPITTIPQSGKTVAVVPSVPGQIRMAATGLTIFENSIDIADVPDWHLDDLTFESASAVLSPRYRVIRVNPDVTLDDPESKLDKSTHSTRFETIVRQHVHPTEPVDFYVVVSPSAVADNYTGRPNVLRYVGVSKFRDIFVTRAPIVHTFLLVTVLDGATFKTLGYSALRISPEESKRLYDGDGFPAQRLQGFAWQNNWGDLTEAQQALVEERVKYLLSTSIKYTLQHMQLGAESTALRQGD